LHAYLGTVGLIRSAELRQVSAGEFVYDLGLRGSLDQLNDAFALRGLLEPVASAEAGTTDVVYRLVTALPAAAPGP
jgi:hypothetical protein